MVRRYEFSVREGRCVGRKIIYITGNYPAVVRVAHVAIEVADLEETKQFYVRELGLEPTWDFSHEGVENHYIAGEDGLEIQLIDDPATDAVDPTGVDHIALTVPDVEQKFSELTGEHNREGVREPHRVEITDATVAYVRGPNGYDVELVEE